MSATQYLRELRFARSSAKQLGKLIHDIRRTGFTTQVKPDRTLVTTADKEANALFVMLAAAAFPADRVLGEEAGREAAGPRTWVIDPLDGTTNYVLGLNEWMVSIALVVDGKPVVAVAYNPSTREEYWATAEGPAYRNGAPLCVSTRDGAEANVLICGTGADCDPADLRGTLLEGRLTPALRLREHGGLPTVFAGCKVAEGWWDGFVYPYDSPWDVAAVTLLIDRAGGMVQSGSGLWQPVDRAVDSAIGSNGLIQQQLVREWMLLA